MQPRSWVQQTSEVRHDKIVKGHNNAKKFNQPFFVFIFLQTNCISDKNTRNFSGFIIKCLCCSGNAVPGVRLCGAGEPRHPHHLPGHAAGGLQVTNQSPTSGHVTDTIGPLLFVLDEAPLQHKILHFGLFQAKTYANGL